MRNAICREAKAQFASNALYSDLRTRIRARLAEIKSELCPEDQKIKFVFARDDEVYPKIIAAPQQEKLLALLEEIPDGVIAMSEQLPDTVETSTNLGKIACTEDALEMSCLLRSLIDAQRNNLAGQMQELATKYSCRFSLAHLYPAWQAQNDTEILRICEQSAQELGITPKVKTIHAGLECGIIKNPYPEMQAVSIGPSIEMPHSPQERVNIASVEKFWQWLLAILRKCK